MSTSRPPPPSSPSWSSGSALPSGTRLGEYEIEQVLREGPESIVYAAHDHGLQRRVALREYLPQGLARRGAGGQVEWVDERHGLPFSLGLRAFAHEARLLARCDHPALLKVLRYWEAQHTGYMVMRWHEGQSLLSVRQAALQPPGEIWLRTLLLEMIGAVEALHAAFAQHRDISPGNILLQPEDRPVLLGFHAARRALAEHGALQTGPAFSDYAPIEAHPDASHLQQGPWSDLYSLAAVMYFCLSGQPPPAATARSERGRARPLSEAARALCAQHPGLHYSPGFLTALDWAFELQPQDRPRSAAEWRAVVQQTASASQHAVTPTAPRAPEPPRAAAVAASAEGPVPLLNLPAAPNNSPAE